MNEMTNTSKASIIVIVVIMTGLMIGFKSDDAIQGLFPEYSEVNPDAAIQCEPAKSR